MEERMNMHQQSDHVSPIWNDPETVDKFAGRDPDRRLVQLVNDYPKPPDVRVLDLGCAGGRNTVLLAGLGFDFRALDSSKPMVARTRERITSICGPAAAEQRVRLGEMADLSEFPDEFFQLIVALGIYHQASSLEHWHDSVAESARVLETGRLLLTSSFCPESQPEGRPLTSVRGMYDGFSSGPLCLFGAESHDQAMAAHGLEPHVPTETVRVETELGFRITLNALYRKCG
jgi:SAM-dependent methyltransferase